MSTVLYARIPDDLKAAADAYAQAHARTLTTAVVDLLGQGLGAAANAPSIAALEEQAQATRRERDALQQQLDAARLQIQALAQRDQTWTSAYRALQERLGRPLGQCPTANCRAPITGVDLLVAGRCTHCGANLSAQVAKATQTVATSKPDDVLIALVAVGLFLGVALAAGGSR